jgi:hypothetical protein
VFCGKFFGLLVLDDRFVDLALRTQDTGQICNTRLGPSSMVGDRLVVLLAQGFVPALVKQHRFGKAVSAS